MKASSREGKGSGEIEGLVCTLTITLLSVHGSEDNGKGTNTGVGASTSDIGRYVIIVVLFAVIYTGRDEVIDANFCVFTVAGYEQEHSLCEIRGGPHKADEV